MVKLHTSKAPEANAQLISDSSLNQDVPPIEADSMPYAKALPNGPGLGRRIWNGWMKVAEFIGTVQMIIILSIMYWLILPFMAIPFRFFSDPLRVRRRQLSNWREKKRDESISPLDSMSNQY